MHTPLCRHATGEPTAYAAHAVTVGLEEIGFSDHSPMPRDDFDDWRMRAADLQVYVEKVEQARAQFPQLRIRLALEVDFLPGQEEWVRDLARRHPWDYLIGSVHYVSEGWAIDNPHLLAEWDRHSPLAVWKAYVERLTAAADSGLFDIIGHADLCKKFGIYPEVDVAGLFTGFLETAARRGVAIELNTAGLRKSCREIYPSAAILEEAARLGVGITFGSDAHAPEETGMDFERAVELARSTGHTHWRRYQGRRYERVPL